MTEHDETFGSPRPPVALGCAFMVTVLVVLFIVGACVTVYLDSGANTGEMELDDARAYAPQSYQYVGERNYFIVRLPDRSFVALSDLDAANRANSQRRCRVQAVPPDDPASAELLALHARRISSQASGWTLVFRETCNGAVYDAAGVRLDQDGRNLDRYPASISPEGNLVVDVSKRECSRRQESNVYRVVECSGER